MEDFRRSHVLRYQNQLLKRRYYLGKCITRVVLPTEMESRSQIDGTDNAVNGYLSMSMTLNYT